MSYADAAEHPRTFGRMLMSGAEAECLREAVARLDAAAGGPTTTLLREVAALASLAVRIWLAQDAYAAGLAGIPPSPRRLHRTTKDQPRTTREGEPP
jgi:hypothetical protein